MSLPRFFLPPDRWQPGILTLEGDEATHCTKVLRRSPGDAIEVFDGAGRAALCEIRAVSKSSVTTAVQQYIPCPAPRHRIHLLPALLKTEPFEWLLEKAVELGAASIRPVITTRTVADWSPAHLEKKLLRCRRHMIEAAKQCHTPLLPSLHAPQPLPHALETLPPGGLKIMPALSEHSRTLRGLVPNDTLEAWVIIGPEGDFTAAEESLALQQGFIPVTLGPLILRAETAALATLAILDHEMR